MGQAQFAVGGNLVAGVHSTARAGSLRTDDNADTVVVSGRDFRYTVDKRTGTLGSMRVRGTELLHTGPELDAWRTPINNEFQSEDRQWRPAWIGWSPPSTGSASRPAATRWPSPCAPPLPARPTDRLPRA